MSFPSEANIPDTSFRQIDHGKYSAAHAWLFCPPFNVLDLTIQLQPYTLGEVNYLPKFVANQVNVIGTPKLSDIASPLAIKYFGMYQVQSRYKELLRLQKVIITQEFTVGKTLFRYIPLAITVADIPLKGFKNLELDGLYPYDFFIKNIKDEVPLGFNNA